MMNIGDIKTNVKIKNMDEFKEKVRLATELSGELERLTKEIGSFRFEFEQTDNREAEKQIVEIIAQAVKRDKYGIRDLLSC